MWTIFPLGEHVAHTPPFLCITPGAWWFTTKKQLKMGDILYKLLPGDLDEIHTFSENYVLTSRIRYNKLKHKKQFFPFFRETGPGPAGGPREHSTNFGSFTLYLLLFFNFTNCPGGTFYPILTKMDFRKFRKKWKILSIALFKQNVQKIIFPNFPKIRSRTCWGSPRTHPRFWCIYPVSITFCPFLPIVPGGHFDQFWPKWIFENFEKNEKC